MDVGRPFLTFYDDATGERTELSRTTFENWVAKTANFLRDDRDVAPGATVGLDLPDHWLTVVVAFAAWRVGAQVARGPGDVAFAHGDLDELRHDVLAYGDRFDAGAPSTMPPTAPDDRRVMVVDADPLPAALAAWAGRGSVVLCRNADPALLAHRVETERVEATY